MKLKVSPLVKKPARKTNHTATAADDYLYRKKLNPLQDKYPRWKNSDCSIKKAQRKEVTDVLVPWMEEFVKTRLKWRKMPKNFHNDSRNILTQYFIGKSYRETVLIDGKEMRKDTWYKPSPDGKRVMDAIKKEIQGFSELELSDTLINVTYRHRIDHYSITLKPFVNTKPDKKAVSLWDKISEKVQV